MSLFWLAVLGLGSPAIGLLVVRWLAADNLASSMRQHRKALAVLAELTEDGAVDSEQ